MKRRREPYNLDVHNPCDVKKVLQYASEIFAYHAGQVNEDFNARCDGKPFDAGKPWQVLSNILYNASVDVSTAEKKGWVPKGVIRHLRVPDQNGIL